MTHTADDIRRAMDRGPMRAAQIMTVAVCLAINLIDGFDVLAIAFTASTLSSEWNLAPDQLGLLFSAGVAGMTIASIAIAPVADRVGRRPTVLASLALITGGMAASALAHGPTDLAVYRFVTGLGIGTLLPSINTLAAEFSSAPRRELAVTTMQAGFPLGATLGGFAALGLIDQFGWRGVFWVGALLSGMMIPIAWKTLPESPQFLLLRQPAGALAQLNETLRRLRLSALDTLPPSPVGSPTTTNTLMKQPHGVNTIALCTAFFCVMAAFYFVASWTPKLLTDAGLSTKQGISGGLLLNIAGVTGGILLGWQARRFGARWLTFAYLVGAIATMAAFATLQDLQSMLLGGALVGFFVIGAMMGLYSIAPNLFPTQIRSTATGLAVGVGRFGAILGPIATGALLADAWDPATIYLVFAVPLAVSAASVGYLARREVRRKSDTSTAAVTGG